MIYPLLPGGSLFESPFTGKRLPMPISLRCVFVSLASLLLLLCQPAFLDPAAVSAAEPKDAESIETISVTDTHDGRPFDYCIKSKVKKSGYTLYQITYPSPVVTQVVQNNTIPAEYYLPDGVDGNGSQRPAVICMHILNGNFALVRMTCTMLASHGIPAMMFKLPYYGERGFPEGPEAMAADPSLLVDSIGQAVHDVSRTIDLLASRPEINPRQGRHHRNQPGWSRLGDGGRHGTANQPGHADPGRAATS